MANPGVNQVFADPLFQSLVSAVDSAAKAWRSALIELRAYHLATTPADCDPWRAALLAQTAETTFQRLEDAQAALTEYGWRLAPYSTSAAHLAAIEAERWRHGQRVQGKGWGPGPTHPEGPEARLGQFTMVLRAPDVPSGDAPSQ